MSSEGRRYRILSTLGKGGFGTVYRAELLAAGGFTKQVALKVLNNDAMKEADFAQRLRDEARVLGLIKHRAVVGVDALAELEHGWAVVMEYVDGIDVQALVTTGALHPKMSVEIIEDVASALHQAFFTLSPSTGTPLQVMHRDIKPANIRVTPQGEVKLLDFGIARADFDSREAQTTGRLYGSFKYMAPERIEAIEGPSADVWSLGIVLAELVCGKSLKTPPKHPDRFVEWFAETEQKMRTRMAAANPPIEGEAQDGMMALCRDMMGFEPEDRLDAKEVERRCRDLKPTVPGPWLREWAEDDVPRLQALAATGGPADEDGMSGQVLSEMTTARDVLDTERIDKPRSPVIPVAVASIALGFTGVLVLTVVVVLSNWPSAPEPPPEPAGIEFAPATPTVEPSEPVPVEPTVVRVEPVEPAAEPVVDTRLDPIAAPVKKVVVVKPVPLAIEPASKSHDLMGLPDDMTSSGPASAAVVGGTVKVTGDAKEVWLISEKGEYPAGAVPPGTYALKVWFDASGSKVAGTLTVAKGQTKTVDCVAATKACSVTP